MESGVSLRPCLVSKEIFKLAQEKIVVTGWVESSEDPTKQVVNLAFYVAGDWGVGRICYYDSPHREVEEIDEVVVGLLDGDDQIDDRLTTLFNRWITTTERVPTAFPIGSRMVVGIADMRQWVDVFSRAAQAIWDYGGAHGHPSWRARTIEAFWARRDQLFAIED